MRIVYKRFKKPADQIKENNVDTRNAIRDKNNFSVIQAVLNSLNAINKQIEITLARPINDENN